MSVEIKAITADWCGPCKMMKPIVAEICEEQGHVLTVIDVDAEPDLCQSLGIRGVPTFIVYKDSVEVKRIVGASTKGSFEATLEAALK